MYEGNGINLRLLLFQEYKYYEGTDTTAAEKTLCWRQVKTKINKHRIEFLKKDIQTIAVNINWNN